MSSFSLRSQRTGHYKEFTLLEILKLLGDTVNDEIWMEDGEDVYNLSSFREIGSSGNGNSATNERWSVETPGNLAGQSIFYLQFLPVTAVLMVVLNGMILTQNKDFYLEGKQIRFSYQLNTQDTLKFIYQF